MKFPFLSINITLSGFSELAEWKWLYLNLFGAIHYRLDAISLNFWLLLNYGGHPDPIHHLTSSNGWSKTLAKVIAMA